MVALQAPGGRLEVRDHEDEGNNQDSADEQVGLSPLLRQVVIRVLLPLIQGHLLDFVVEGDFELQLSDRASDVCLLKLVKRLRPVCNLLRTLLQLLGAHGAG